MKYIKRTQKLLSGAREDPLDTEWRSRALASDPYFRSGRVGRSVGGLFTLENQDIGKGIRTNLKPLKVFHNKRIAFTLWWIFRVEWGQQLNEKKANFTLIW